MCVFRALFYDQKKIHCFYFAIFDYTLLALFWLKFLNKFMMGIYALVIDFISLYKDKLWHLLNWRCDVWTQDETVGHKKQIKTIPEKL